MSDSETRLPERYGNTWRNDRPVVHRRPDGLNDDDVQALGKLSEALEVVEHARGLLYGFHRLSGTADRTLQEAVQLLRDAGHRQLADDIEQVLVGRDVIAGKWSFQLVESYDDDYWTVFREVSAHAHHVVGQAPHHLFEAEMQYREQHPAG